VAVLCYFWTLEWEWQHGQTNLGCVFVSGIRMLNLNLQDFIVPEISIFIRTDFLSCFFFVKFLLPNCQHHFARKQEVL